MASSPVDPLISDAKVRLDEIEKAANVLLEKEIYLKMIRHDFLLMQRELIEHQEKIAKQEHLVETMKQELADARATWYEELPDLNEKRALLQFLRDAGRGRAVPPTTKTNISYILLESKIGFITQHERLMTELGVQQPPAKSPASSDDECDDDCSGPEETNYDHWPEGFTRKEDGTFLLKNTTMSTFVGAGVIDTVLCSLTTAGFKAKII